MLDRLLRAIGIAQGGYFLWFTLGGGAVVIFVATGLLAVYGGLPWWSMLGIGLGLLMLAMGVLNWIAKTTAARMAPQSEAYHDLTMVIEDGRRLRERLNDLREEPSEDDKSHWKLRLDTWSEDADAVVARVAPFRLAAFRLEFLTVDVPWKPKADRPKTVGEWEADLEYTLERLLYIRVTL